MLFETLVLRCQQVRVALLPEPFVKCSSIASRCQRVAADLSGRGDEPGFSPQRVGRIVIRSHQRRIVPRVSGVRIPREKVRRGSEQTRRRARRREPHRSSQQRIRAPAVTQCDQQLRAVLECDRLLSVFRQGAFRAPPDVRIAEDVVESFPRVFVVGSNSEQPQECFARDVIAVVAAQIESHLHLPVPRLRVGGSEASRGTEILECGVAADHALRKVRAARRHQRIDLCGLQGQR